MFKSEMHLTSLIYEQLSSCSFHAYKEVPMLGRSIDMVLLRNNKIISIEFKMHNWKGAIKQAKDYLLASDYVYICMPRRKVSEALLMELKSNGIGLLFPNLELDWPFEEVVKAKPSSKKWKVARRNLKAYIKHNYME